VTVPMSARRRPPGRYDEPSLVGQRVLAVVLGLLFVGLLAAVVSTLYARYGDADVRFRELGFAVVSDNAVRVDFEVTRPTGETAYCVVRARDAAGVETGREIVPVDVGAEDDTTVRASHLLRTEDRAVTGEVQRCSLRAPRADGLSP
jgi:hypothetical protein